jgi:hypothetical protein
MFKLPSNNYVGELAAPSKAAWEAFNLRESEWVSNDPYRLYFLDYMGKTGVLNFYGETIRINSPTALLARET